MFNSNLKLVDVPLSPAEIVRSVYLEPSGMSMNQFSKLIGVGFYQLQQFLRGYSMSIQFIEKLSNFTGKTPEYWYQLQLDFLFAKFCKRHLNNYNIAPIAHKPFPFQVREGTPGQILFEKYLKPTKWSISRISDDLKINSWTLLQILAGDCRIDYSIAVKLSAGLGTSVRYWIIIQLRYDIEIVLNSKRKFSEIKDELKGYMKNLIDESVVGVDASPKNRHPSQILLDEYIIPSKIPLVQWRKLFCVSRKLFKPMLECKRELPLEFLIKLAQLFEKRISFWLDLQINYYSTTSILPDETKKLNKKKEQFPGDKLLNDFVYAANWSINDFANHIGVKPRKLYYLRDGRTTINFDLAIRFGAALDMNPKYWLVLQMQHSLSKGHKPFKFKKNCN